MQLYFIRHAQSNNNLLFIQTGESKGRNEDPELSRLGQEQARRLAAFYAALPVGKELGPEERGEQVGFTHLYCSLMVRAIETGLALSRTVGVPLVGLKDLHEAGGIYLDDFDTGERNGLPGKRPQELAERFPEVTLPEGLNPQGWWNRPFEAREERLGRARRLLDLLLERHGGTQDRVVVVSHAGFYNVFMRAVLDLDGAEGLWFALNNTGVTRLDFYADEKRVAYMNRLCHLPVDLVS